MTDALRELATAHGVATEYWDWRNEHVQVRTETLIAVLARARRRRHRRRSRAGRALRRARTAALAAQCCRPAWWCARASTRTVDVHVADGESVDVWITLEDGATTRTCASSTTTCRRGRSTDAGSARPRSSCPRPAPRLSPPARVQRRRAARHPADRHAGLARPAGPPRRSQGVGPGHPALQRALARLVGRRRPHRSRRPGACGRRPSTTPPSCWSIRCTRPSRSRRCSRRRTCRRRAGSPTRSTCASSASPSTRARHRDATVGRRDAISTTDGDLDRPRRGVDGQARGAAGRSTSAGRSAGRELAYRAFCRREGHALDDFAAWCALTEVHGPDWHDWPRALPAPAASPRSPSSPRPSTRTAVDFHRWLQWLLDEQLADAQSLARRSGMALGMMHDLAVGVSPTGADSWAWQDEFARGMTVGAPPDAVRADRAGLEPAAVAARPPGRARLRPVARADRQRAAPLRRPAGRSHHRPVPAVVDPVRRGPDRGHLRALRPRRADRHPRARGGARRRGDRRRGPRHGRAVGARLPARARPARHVRPVVRVRLRRRRRPARAGTVARVLPRLGDHARPAADGRLSRRRPRPAAQRPRPAHPLAGRGTRRRSARADGLAGLRCAQRGLLGADADRDETVAGAAPRADVRAGPAALPRADRRGRRPAHAEPARARPRATRTGRCR